MQKVGRGRASAVIASLVTALVALLMVTACSGSSTDAGGSSTNTIVIQTFAFAPAEITVSPGARIRVMNQDTASHTATANDKAFDSRDIGPFQSTEFTAPGIPGSYPYRCTFHPFMTGLLIVK